jgi:DNA replication protein DnaC
MEECIKCGGTGYVVVERNGLSGAEYCECHYARIAEQRIPRAGIPSHYESATFDTFKIAGRTHNPVLARAMQKVFLDVRGYVRNYLPTAKKPGLLIWGPHGCGKTHLAVAALRELLSKGYEGAYFDYQTLLDRIAASWNQTAGTADKEAYETALDVPILLLDDLGARRAIDWVEDTVTAIITNRCNNNRTLIATTNLPLEPVAMGATEGGSIRNSRTLPEVIGMRAASRLYEMCRIIDMSGIPDYRPGITA